METQAPIQQQNPIQQQVTPLVSPPPKKHTYLWVLIGIIVLLIGIGVGIFFRN
jgi:hypothetical protein